MVVEEGDAGGGDEPKSPVREQAKRKAPDSGRRGAGAKRATGGTAS